MSPSDGTPPPDTAEKSLGEIVSDVSEKASLLVRQEIDLAKAEVTDKVSKLGTGAGVGAAAGVFLVFGITMFCHFLALFFNDLFDWNTGWPGYLLVTLLLVIAAAISAFVSYRFFKRGGPPTPDMAIEEARKTRAEFEGQRIHRDQLPRTLEKGEEVKA
jgi:Putative Actinobacterial Holin-X, holin superfamily III